MTEFGDLVGRDDVTGNDGDLPGYASPVTAAEIEDLLYSEEWPADERITRLTALRDQLAAQEVSDFGDDDPMVLIGQIDDALARLAGLQVDELEPGGLDIEPIDHRETLAPDSDELAEIEAEDLASLDEADEPLEPGPLDSTEWVDGDGFDPARGVR